MSDHIPLDSAPPIDPPHLPMVLQRILLSIIILSIPPVLILSSVRVVMTEQFLRLEYQRPGFPDDPYGFSTDDRLEYGPYGVRYLLNDQDISYLGNLTIDGRPAFNDDELHHMEDVKEVTRAAFQVLLIIGAFMVGSMVLLARIRTARPTLRRALRWGGRLTLGLVVVAVLFIVVAWGFFFDTFHEVFFEDGTWQFHKSDTLIRLYPEQFWFDATLAIAILTAIGVAMTQLVPWYWEKRLEAPDDASASD